MKTLHRIVFRTACLLGFLSIGLCALGPDAFGIFLLSLPPLVCFSLAWIIKP
jgi:hypothetical protein